MAADAEGEEGTGLEEQRLIKERLRAFQESLHPFNKFSQFGEDGIVQDVFNRIGISNRYLMECGAADGVFFSNSRKLIQDGWTALLIEADEKQFEKLAQRYLENPRVTCYNYTVEPTGAYSFDALLAKAEAPTDIDLAVIDIDGGDYWLWNSLLKYRPRVVLCEFAPNAPGDFIPEIDGEGQAGRDAIVKLGYGKLYYPVAQTYCNLIFVRQDLLHSLTDDGDPVDEREIRDLLPVKIAAAMSTPRVGFMGNVDCVYAALAPFNVPLARGEGAYWHHSLSRSIQAGLDKGAEFILTIDYDTLFTTQDLAKLVCLLQDNEDIDVVVSMQQKREGGELLASSDGSVNLLDELIPINQGHFGLSLFRSSVFERISKPWFRESPNSSGDWGENRTDADIAFWKNCVENGINIRLAADVVIGHLELVATWPDCALKPHYQPVNDWRQSGQVKPEGAFDRVRLSASVNAPLAKAALEMKG